MRCEIAKLFGVLPYTLKRLPLSEFQIMYRYWLRMRSDQNAALDTTSEGPKDGTIQE